MMTANNSSQYFAIESQKDRFQIKMRDPDVGDWQREEMGSRMEKKKFFSVDLLSSIAIGAMVLHILKGQKKHY